LFPTIFLHSNNPLESLDCFPIFSQLPPSMNGLEVGVGVGVGVGVEVTSGVGEGVGLGVGNGVGAEDGFGFGIATPLFQTNFLPLFTHVNFLPLAVAVVPTFLQASPALTAAKALRGRPKIAIAIKTLKTFFTYEC